MQATDPRMIVLIPCMNEEGRIGNVVRSVGKYLPNADIAVINDASTDASDDEATEAGAIVMTHGCNLGYGAALETGYLYAVRNRYDVLIQMDGDGQHPADQLPVLIKPVMDGSADLAIGSRYKPDGTKPPVSIIRRVGHKFFAMIILVLTGRRLSDPTSGFQCLNRRTLALFSSGVFPCDYPDSDVILMAHMSGLRIREVPVTMLERVGGVSMHSGLKPIYYGMKMLLSMFIVLLNFRVWRERRDAAGCPPDPEAPTRKD